MRSDSVLITGATGASINKAQDAMARRKEQKKERLSKRARIQPAIEPVLELLTKEQNKTMLEALNFIDSGTDETTVKNTLTALRLYKDSMQSLKNSISAIMRVEE